MKASRRILLYSFLALFLSLPSLLPPLAAADDPTVYITRTGAKYHSDGCRYLSRSRIPILLSRAVKGYTPCSVCNPPVPVKARAKAIISPKAESVIPATEKPAAISQPVVKPTPPIQAENGDVRGADNDGDGRTEPVYVKGYYKKDGTYVRSHYRASPRK